MFFGQIQKRGSSVCSSQFNFNRIPTRPSDILVLRSSLRKSLKIPLNTKYKKNSCSSLQSNRCSESAHRLSLDLPRNRFMSDRETGANQQIVINQPMSSKRKRSQRYGLSFHELNETSQENMHVNYSYLDDNAVSTF